MTWCRALVITAALAIGCNGRAGPTEPHPLPETPVKTDSTSTFADGPALTPAADLLAWFEGEGKTKLVRIPVVVESSPLGVTGGTLGTAPDALRLKLDDGAMAVSLFDRLREHCPAQDTCALWIEGVWGETVTMPTLGPPATAPAKHPFSVRGVVGPVGETDVQRVLVAR